jgi:hypothetical protein
MELREFVAETLIAIQEGVRDAILGIDERKVTGKVNPVWNVDPGAKVDWRDYVQSVEFDVAVTATDKAEATGKGGIKVLTIAEFGAEGSKSTERSTVSRIKFSIPIVPPAQPANRNPA